ncbi:SEED MATURATION PROTEIN 1-like [Raphanus sativus]|uniref:SEED MATURATION PROTEIN 1-like n=1 Tax=Raphanus sativus TaxID=3726 RepID=A0A6J0JPS9_RAPSA|nr:SEED MATURATION PROTEIN 1-like [Raphanus sativus]XP_018438830.1 SEED MATURATION PROTEIN 1-like [Raphanus sativus]
MAKNKDDIKYATAQTKQSEDEAIRVRYKHGTPLEGGKIAESEPVELFASAQGVEKGKDQAASEITGDQTQMHRDKAKDVPGTRTDDSLR